MGWRVANSLISMRDQINAVAPDRDKAWDGTIGDTAHSKTKSEHNPDAFGIVRAFDATNDPEGGFDAHAFAERLLRSQDPRLRYVISNGRIGSGPAGPQPGVWRKYNGSNQHTHHAHVSVMPGALGDRAGNWGAVSVSVAPRPQRPDSQFSGVPDQLPILRRGAESGWVYLLQDCLGLDRDGKFGPGTEEGVRRQQRNYGLDADGIVGPWTWVSFIANAGNLSMERYPQGHSGIEVLQNMLHFRGSDLDRKYGPGTAGRVKQVQAWAGLDPDGKVGPNTRRVLAVGRG